MCNAAFRQERWQNWILSNCKFVSLKIYALGLPYSSWNKILWCTLGSFILSWAACPEYSSMPRILWQYFAVPCCSFLEAVCGPNGFESLIQSGSSQLSFLFLFFFFLLLLLQLYVFPFAVTVSDPNVATQLQINHKSSEIFLFALYRIAMHLTFLSI